MNSHANTLAIASIIGIFATSLAAQQAVSSSVAEPSFPTYKLEFHAGQPIPGVAASNVIEYPAQCSPDGAIFLGVMIGPGFQERAVVALNPKGGQQFSLSAVPNLSHVSRISYFPTGSTIAFLVAAAQADAPDGPPHFYILLFDRDGSYQSTVELPSDKFQYRQLAVLTSGNFLILGFNGENRAAEVRLYSSNGQFLRTLELPQTMHRDSELNLSEASDPVASAKKMMRISLWHFAPVRGSVILYEPSSISAALEILGNGATREVQIAAPKGYILNSVIPGADQFIARFQREDISMTQPVAVNSKPSSENFVLYKIDPRDGSLVERLKEQDSDHTFEIACEAAGILQAVSLTPDNRFAISTADLPR